MNTKKTLLVFILLSLAACLDTGSTGSTDSVGQKGHNASVATATSDSPYNGTYLFDTETYKSEQLKHEDSIFKKLKPEDLERMMQVFKPFKIEVAGQNATAVFSHDIIKGSLKTIRRTNEGAHLFMTPLDENKTDQTVTLIIEADRLVLDPGRKETDKMFFKRTN
ncbi:MAG: hypothetical protein HQM16_00800 [Deltaproteobacteria bacterium]|nr:hypothetical protein [Deltaproteobacteria bacterium]